VSDAALSSYTYLLEILTGLVGSRCRWILSMHDRADQDALLLTHEFLAEMLGVQRSTVSVVPRTFQTAGLIWQSRGSITVIDRAGLEERACERYGRIRRIYERLLPATYAPAPSSKGAQDQSFGLASNLGARWMSFHAEGNAVARFYFDRHNQARVIRDDGGNEFRSPEAAIQRAARSAAAIGTSRLVKDEFTDVVIAVRDERDWQIVTVTTSLKIERHGLSSRLPDLGNV
jgi:hypothetical protein